MPFARLDASALRDPPRRRQAGAGGRDVVLDKFRLDGRVALVTGAGTGLGEAMAAGLAEAGADVAAVYNQHFPQGAQAAVQALGRRFLPIRADLRSIAPIPGILQQTLGQLGRLDILVNDAGIIRRRPSVDYTEEDWDVVMDVNIKSLFFLCQAAGRYFVQRGQGGKIINIASMLSFQGGILIPSYTSSKSAVRGLTMTLAKPRAGHLGPHSGGALGRAGRPQGRGRLPGLCRFRLHARLHPGRGRRLAGAIDCASTGRRRS